ncbi:MAG: ABC transporter permease [Fibrella sp.]|nr:ABC transporter permease [Armatimonadota bacterium]
MPETSPDEKTDPAKTPAANGPEAPHAEDTIAEEVVEVFEEVGQFSFQVVFGTIASILSYLGEVVTLFGETVRSLFQRGVHMGDLFRQMAIIGVESLPISLLTIGFSGAVLALYSVNTLKTYGAAGLVGGIVALSIVRETGPILTGVAIAARAGSAITAEIGSMKVSEQIDALRSMAITPVEYLVKPRLIAALIMLPLVTVFADIAGVLGGAIVAASKGVSWTEYLSSIQQLMEADGSDITKGLLKTVVFGAIIALVGCREGLETEGGASGVGQSTTRSVVIAIVLIFISDFLLTFLLFNKGIVE